MIEGLYIHIPFCIRRCPYCDFNSTQGQTALIPDYLRALQADLASVLKPALSSLKSIYFGGGTPSLLQPSQVEGLLEGARRRFQIPVGCEITLEANPGTVGLEKLKGYRRVGINRLSLGVQAAQDRILSVLGRIHDAATAEQSVTMARDAGFDNLNLDLMFGLPGQSHEDWEETLAWALSLRSEHLSFYGLSIEEGTPFSKALKQGGLDLPDEDLQARMYQTGQRILRQAGFAQYEISNFAREGKQSAHNPLYWKNRPTLGLGAGAWSYIDGRRFSRLSGVREYVEKILSGQSPVLYEEQVEGKKALGERAFLGLRMVEGIDLEEWKAQTGRDWFADFSRQTETLRGHGFLELSDGRIRIPGEKLCLANEVFVEFV